MNLNIRSGTVWYNNKILISDGKFSLGKNNKVNALKLAVTKNSKAIAHSTTTHGLAQKQAITHEEERAALILFLTGGFTMWFLF